MSVAVSVIVVTYNAAAHIERCARAVLGAGGEGVELELLVVDNESTDDTVALVHACCADDPRVRVLHTGRNGGMAAGNNYGMARAGGEAFLLLNADAFLQPGCLRALVDELVRADSDSSTSAVAAVVPRLENVDGSHQRSLRGFPTPWRYLTEFAFLRRVAPGSRLFNAFYGGGVDIDAPGEVEWATGACLLVPRGAVDEVGLMDEGYFMYGEEVDWLARMRRAGRRVRYEPAAVATHVGGGSARRSWGHMYQQQLANHVRYMQLNDTPRAALATQRVLTLTLRARAGMWRALAKLSGGDGRREARIARSRAFADGARTVASIDARATPQRIIPPWPSRSS